MKRQLLHLFFILFLATLCTAEAWGQAKTITPTQPSGYGTSGSPYLIGTVEELFWFTRYVNTKSGNSYPNMGACAKLTADIAINEGTFSCDESDKDGQGPSYAPLYNGNSISDDNAPIVWEPIGMGETFARGYYGTFDGNGKTISGVYMTTTTHWPVMSPSNNGFFCVVGHNSDKNQDNSKAGTVRNLTIKNSYIGNDKAGSGGSGGIAGTFSMGTIENCQFEGTVVSSSAGAGGIVFSLYCVEANSSKVPQLLNCRNYGQVISTSDNAGGIVYQITRQNSSYAGTIKNCSNHGKVISTSASASGLAYSAIEHGSMENCYNTGEVSGSTGSYGLFESNGATITKCYNSGTLTGSNTKANYSSNFGTINNCYSTAGSAQTGVDIISDTDFKSGKFTYDKLNDGMDPDTDTPTWGQILKGPLAGYPTTGGQKVYKSLISGADSYDNVKYISSEGILYCRINDAFALRCFARYFNDETTYGTPVTINACLSADIDLSDEPWTPIGNAQKPYTGIFDGQRHLISGLRIENATTDAALIHTLGNSTGIVRNLGISTGNISTTAQAGAICVQNNGTISNCYSLIPVSGGSGSNAGALCSVNAGTIEYSFTTQPTLYGSTSGTVTNSYSLLPTATGNDSDTDGSTSGAKSDDFFRSGKMAWYLNGASSANLNWQQDLGPNPAEGHPRFYDGTGAHKVLRILLYNKLTTTGGTGTSYTYMNPQNYVLPTVTGNVVVEPLTKTGYHPGWSDKEGGTDSYSLGETVTEDLTLYESWIANHFNVTYHANHSAAPGSTTTQELVYDRAGQALAANTFSRTGYTFHQWCTQSDNTDGQGTTYADQATQDTQGQININQLTAEYPNGNFNLYALWTPNTYTVHFDANCPAELTTSGTMADQTHTYDVEQALTVNAFVCQGRTFIGWSTDANATEPTYAETVSGTTTTGAIVKNLTADVNGKVTLYAVWRHQALWIKFHPNRGEGDDNDDDKVSESAMEREYFISETPQAITQNTYTRPGYTFDGWKTDKNAETALYTDQQSITLRAQREGEEVTFYAHWKPLRYTVTVKSESIKKGSISIADENGAQISGSSYTTDYRNYILLLATPRSGYQFAQWSDGNTEAERVYRVPFEGATLTAQFSEETKTVTIQTGSDSQEIQVGKDGTGLAEALAQTPNSIAIIEPNSGITVPVGLSNVIVKSSSTMGTCSNLALTDKAAFSTPVKFTAESVTYTRNLTDYTYANGTDGWSTLLVPFDGTLYADETPLSPFGSNADTNGRYWLKTFTGGISNGTLNFAYATQIRANQPYIIALPGDTWGSENSLKGKTITVRATDVTISASPNPKESVGGDYSFTGTYDGLASATTCYQLNAAGNTFEKTGNAVEPFRCYLALLNNTLSAPMAFSIGDENGTITGIQEHPADGQGLRVYARDGNIIIEATQPGTARIYSIDSRLIRTVNVEEGVNTVSGLTRGFYIVEKQKVILK